MSTKGGESASSGAAPAPAAPLLPATAHGVAAAFDPALEEWAEYVEILTDYLLVNYIEAGEKRRVILLNAVGASTRRLIKTLMSPAKVTDLSFDDIMETARKHYSPKLSLIV